METRQHRWPGGARCVALLTVDFDGTGNEVGQGFDPAGIRAAGGYSARRGVPRMLDIFERHGIPATFFVPAFDAGNHPDIVREIVRRGHEIGAHGYLHERWEIPADEEEPLLRMAHDTLVDVTGLAPKGWRSPGGMKSADTLKVLRELGYIYDSSDKDYDLPYPAIVGGEQSSEMIELPNNTSSLDDTYLYVEGAATPDEVLQLWLEEFDAIYHEGGYFMLTFHPRAGFGSGIPARASVIERLIPAIRRYSGVEFMRLGDLAEWWLERSASMTSQPIWPGGAQCAVLVTVNYDGESVERSERPEGALWGRYSYGRYGVQTGLPRMLGLLERHQIAATFFVPGWDVERDPEVVRDVRDRGHEIAGHGYLHEDFSSLSASEQEDVLSRSEAAFAQALGDRPAGWRAPDGLMTSETRSILVARGYSYESSYSDDDLPYRVDTGEGAPLVEIPVFQTASDSHYYRLRRSPDVVERAWRTEFISVYRVGGLFNLTLHPRGDVGSGRAARLRAVDRLLQLVRSYPRVWLTTCGELAAWALDPSNDAIETWPA